MGLETPVKSPAQDSPAVDATEYKTIWDARPRKYKNVLLQVTLFILIMELAERLSFFGVEQGLRNFMVKIGWSSVSASALKSTWGSVCFCSPLFAAWLADEKWGRFRTMLTLSIWYLVGAIIITIAAHPDVSDKKGLVTPIFLIGLFPGIAVGTGGIKSNAITLGADQFDPNDPREVAQKETFFSYFYWSVNIGALVAFGYFTTLTVDGGGFISAEYGYFGTYAICCIIMAGSIITLVIGYPRYVHQPPTDRTISTLVHLIWDSRLRNLKGRVLVIGTLSFFLALLINIGATLSYSNDSVSQALSYVAGVLVLVGFVSWIYVGIDQSFLNASKASQGGLFDDSKVDGYKKLIKCLPFASFMIMWNLAYDQADANLQAITQQCDLRWHTDRDDSSQIPGAALTVFDPIVIIIGIPILETCIYPLYKKWAGKPASQFGKATIGLFIAAFGLLWTGVFEKIRRNAGPLVGSDGGPILDDGGGQPMNDISWAYAVPNYMFVAVAECLINVTAYDVYYSTVPLTLKSTAIAVNLFMLSMGSVATSVFTIMFTPYMKYNNLNEDKFEYMFFTVGAISILNAFGFIYIMKKMDFTLSTSPTDSVRGHFDQELEGKGSISRASLLSTSALR